MVIKRTIGGFLTVVLLLIGLMTLAKPVLAEGSNDETIEYTMVAYGEVTNDTFVGALGTSVNIDISVFEEDFLFYIHNGEIITNINNQFMVTKSNNIIVVLEDEEHPVTIFLDSNGALLDAGFVDGYVFAGEEPTKPGMSFLNFVDHAENNKVKTAAYELTDNEVVDITVVGGTYSPVDVKQGQVVTLEPTNLEEFTYWADEDGQVVSTNPNYRFTAAFALTLNAVHDLDHEAKPNVYLTNVTGIREGYKSFLGYVGEVEGYTLVEYGVLAHDEAEVLTLDTQFVEVIPSTSLTVNNEFLRTINDELEMLVSFRAYAIFNDGTELITVYSDNNFVKTPDIDGGSFVQKFSISSGQSSYAQRTIMGVHGENWIATDARTDEKIYDGNTITIRSGSLSTILTNGLSSLKFNYQKKHSDSQAGIEIYINEVMVGERISVANDTSLIHNYTSEILEFEGEITLEIKINGRIAIDNIVWEGSSQEGFVTKLLEVEFLDEDLTKEVLLYGENVEKPIEPNKVGFTFDGWFIDGTNEMYDFNTPITRHLRLVARFTQLNEYTVIFDLNGGIGNIDNQVVFEGEVALEPENVPTHETLVFYGWTTTKDSDDYYDFETLVFKDITLYAKWEIYVGKETFLEEFEGTNLATGSTYGNSTYTGINNINWTLTHVQEASNASGNNYGINEKGVLLRRSNEPSSMKAVFETGITSFSFDFRRGYTGTGERRIEVVVNGETYTVHKGTLNEDDGAKVNTYTYDGPELTGEVTIVIQLFGSTGNQHVVIDNFAWTTNPQ